MLDELRAGGYNMDRFHLVCNRVEREATHRAISLAELLDRAGAWRTARFPETVA